MQNPVSETQNGQLATLMLRVLIAGALSCAIIQSASFQPSMNALWNYLRSNTFYRSSVFETVWTVFCYAAFEPWVTYIFIQHPEQRISFPEQENHRRAKPRGMKRPSRRLREAITYVTPLLLMDLIMIKKFADVSLEAKLASGNYDLTSLKTTHSGNFLLPSVHNFTLSSPLQLTRALPQDAPSTRRVALELIGSLIIYDASFFLFHLSLHILPGLKSWHAPHHTHQEIHPQITNQLSIFERLGLILLANFSLNIIGSHVLTRTLFVPVFVWLLIEIHSGLDTWWSYDKILPAGWGGGAKKHKMHHEHGLEGAGLEPFFCWCDALYQRIHTKG